MAYKVAVVGATGAVGREILKTLAERGFPVREVVALAAGRSAGQPVSFGEDQVLKTLAVENHDFAGTHLVFFAQGAKPSAAHAPRAAAAGCMVIDTSDRFRMEPDVPLVVPEVNAAVLDRPRKRRIIANPDAAVIQLAVALKPLHDMAAARRVVVASYQAVSGAGKEAMDELWSQARGMYVNEMPPAEQFPKQIAFNVIPQTDTIMEDGATRDEWRLAVEMRKLLDPDIAVMATCVRVPVFIGHALAVSVEFERAIGEKQAWAAWRDAPGLAVMDRREDGGYATPIDIAGEDAVHVSRLRRDATVPHGLAFWCVADNLRKGSALNAVQIAEELVARKLLA
jgi:aspartate-semialdehyde dehydrogenase